MHKDTMTAVYNDLASVETLLRSRTDRSRDRGAGSCQYGGYPAEKRDSWKAFAASATSMARC